MEHVESRATAQLPRYKCHKEVWAFKIEAIRDYGDDGAILEGGAFGSPVNAEYTKKHKPEVGGYYVLYADGYESYSPAKAFEDGYSLIRDGQTSSAL